MNDERYQDFKENQSEKVSKPAVFAFIESSKTLDKIEVINSIGQQILIQNVDKYKHSVDLSEYPKGVYLLKIFQNKALITETIIVR